MPTFECPPNYSCAFTHDPQHPPAYDVWWEGPWGVVVGILALAAFTAMTLTLGYYLWKHRSQVQAAKLRERDRDYALRMEEQRTMRLDAAKGNPEVLKLVQQMQRR